MLKNILSGLILISVIILSNSLPGFSQCCAGSCGSPIAGGASQGVLSEHQLEFNTNFQFTNSNKFYKEDSPDTANTFDSFESIYEYFRIGYGVTKNFTMSVESGYFIRKKETGLNGNPATTYESSGFGDLILFPKYDILNRTGKNSRTEITLGLGVKIPLGSYNDSTGNIEPFSGQTYYVTNPTAVQLSSGAMDIIYYTSVFRGFTEKNFRVFANGYYISKGYNANGEKMGNFASVSLFAGKTVLKNFGITLQARYEWMDRMQINESVLIFGKPSNYFPEATGYKKVFMTPQLSYSKGNLTVFAALDFPLYQYLNTSEFYTQAGSEHQSTFGISYKIFLKKSGEKKVSTTGKYFCPMHPEQISELPAKCPICHMELEKAK